MRDLSWLLRFFGISSETIAFLRSLNTRYRICHLPKDAGGFRVIAVPPEELMRFQRQLQRHLLRFAPISDCVHGSMRGHSTKTQALMHRQASALLSFDLKDAFTQATVAQVADAFRFLAFDDHVSEMLAALTTFDGSLPQGAPTSNMLWNLVCRQLDERLLWVAERFDLTYTRYTDELFFSHPQTIERAKRQAIETWVEQTGFVLNCRKTRYQHVRSGALQLTGLSIHAGLVTVTRAEIERLRALVHMATVHRLPRAYIEGEIGRIRHVYRPRLMPHRLWPVYERYRSLCV